MIIGIDKGASAVKLAAVDNGSIIYLKTLVGDERPLRDLYFEFLSENVLGETQVDQIAVTGVGAEKAFFEGVTVPVRKVPEIEATGCGGTELAREQTAIVVSIGTGTSLVLARDGSFTHIGGSGVGSGTLRGLSRKMFGRQDVRDIFKLAETGNRLNVDLTVGDLFSGTDTLPPDLTASNLAKAADTASEEDWAKAVVNMVLEVAGSHAAMACKSYNVDTVIVTGGVTATRYAREVYDNFTRLYHLNYIVPEHSAYATAIGAASIAMRHGA